MTTLDSISAAIVDCEHKTAPVGDGYALSVGTKAMKNGQIILDACKPVNADTYEAWTRRTRPQEGDLILAREAPVGQVVRVPPAPPVCLGQRTVLVRPNTDLVEPRFLHYWLLGPAAQHAMTSVAAGATVPHLNVADIRALDISDMPQDRAVQTFASETLGALDDLIENNRQRVRVLEEMARAIYREWFIQFRYPRAEATPFVDSPLGRIPQDWEVTELESLADLRGGSTATKQDYTSVGYTAFSASGPDGYLADFEVDGKGVVLSSVGARCGRTFRASGRWSSIANTIKILPIAGGCSPAWLALSLQDPALFPKRGSAQPFVSINDARRIRLIVPTPTVMESFERVVGPMFDLVDAFGSAAGQLAAARDLLLPKLVTGQIDVSQLDVDALTEAELA